MTRYEGRRRGPLRRRLHRAQVRRAPELVSGFWFLTSLVALLGPVLAWIVIAIDKVAGEGGLFPTLYISPDSARTILGSVSGSLITIASLTSSLTIVTLQLLSNQYTPRTVRGFLATRLSQGVLGSFIGIFLYCLTLLVTVRNRADDNAPFVPSLGVLLSLVLALVGLILLVVFIHAMSQTIQVSTMAARIGAATIAAIERVHGAPNGGVDGIGRSPAPLPGDGPSGPGRPVAAPRTGYVRGIDATDLLDALEPSTRTQGPPVEIRFSTLPGDFVTPSSVVASVWSNDAARAEVAVRDCVIVEREREDRVDPAYGVRQLVDITLRALSAGINDPSTAVTCMGYVQEMMEILSAHELPATMIVARGSTRITVAQPTFESYLELYVEIAPYAISDVRVARTMLDGLDAVARSARDEHRRSIVRAVRDELQARATDAAMFAHDRERLAGD